MDYREINYHDEIRKNYLYDLHRNINTSIKNKAMLSLKYDDLNFWVTLVQVSIIFISTGLTVMNSIKSYYNVQSQAIDVTSIVMTALIGLIMAIYRFYKMDERKESLCNLRDNYTGIINKFKKVIHKMDKYVIKEDNFDDWNQVVSNYQDEVIDSYLQISETFDTIFDYQDVIHYKNKFKKLFLQHEIINNEIDTVHFFKKEPMSQYQTKKQEGLINENTALFCSPKKAKHLNFDEFIGNYENKYLTLYQAEQNRKRRNQDLYRTIIKGITDEEFEKKLNRDEVIESTVEPGQIMDGKLVINEGAYDDTYDDAEEDNEERGDINDNDNIDIGNSNDDNETVKREKNPLKLTIETPSSRNQKPEGVVHIV